MPVQMDRMNVVTRIAHAQPVPLALRHAEHRMHLMVVRKCDSVDRPSVEAALGRILLGKGHVEDLIWLRRRGWISELSIVPVERFGGRPQRLALRPAIF